MALEYLDNAAKIRDSEELHLLKAEILLPVNKKEAVKEYNNLIKSHPDNQDYVIRLANLHIQDKNYLKARKVLKRYLKRNPKERSNKRFAPYRILIF